MLIPSIDLMGGRIVQLVQGEKLRLAFDDFEYWIERFSSYPLVQLIDLDAAMRQGDNRGLIFGSILFREHETQPVATGVAASIAEAIGPERFVASIDSKAGRVAIRGWKQQTQVTPLEAVRELEAYCGSFLYTHVDTEGMLTGFPIAVAEQLRAATERSLIVAGGIREQSEIDALDAMGVDAVAGMAVYTGLLPA